MQSILGSEYSAVTKESYKMFSLALFLPLVMASAFSFDLVTNESLSIISNNSWSASIQLNK